MFEFKKKIAALLAFVMILTCTPIMLMTGCKDSNWQDQAAGKLPQALASDTLGQVYVNGEVLSYPLKISDLLSHGWKYQESFKDIEKETLDPCYSTGLFAMSGKGKQTLEITATNNAEETLALNDCYVETMSLRKETGDVMLPGGMYVGQKFSTRDEIQAKLPEDFATSGMSGDILEYTATFISADGYTCMIYLRFKSSKDSFVLNEVMYKSNFTPEVRSMLNDTLEAVIKKNDAEYSKYYPDSQAYIQEARNNLIVSIVKVYGFDGDSLTPEQIGKLDQYFLAITAQTTWTVDDQADVVNVDFSYPNLEEQLDAAYDAAFTTYLDQYEECDSIMTDPILMDMFVDALCSQQGEAKIISGGHFSFQKDPATKVITDDDFSDLLFSIMGLYEFVTDLRAG